MAKAKLSPNCGPLAEPRARGVLFWVILRPNRTLIVANLLVSSSYMS